MDPLSATVSWIFANFYWLLGASFAFAAAIALLTFLRGFLLGLNQLFYIDGNQEHVDHARVHATHGVIALLNLFVIWTNIRLVVSLLGDDSISLYSVVLLDLVYLGLWFLWWLYRYLQKKSGIK